MSARRPVVATLAGYRAAVAELPVSAVGSEAVQGAVVVVPGRGSWWDSLVEAQEAGAAAVVVANPLVVPAEALDALAGTVEVPVIVERPWIRPDVVADVVRARADARATLVAVECAAPAQEAEAVMRDALRWAAVLAPGSLKHPGNSAGNGLALLEADTSTGVVPVTLGTGVLPGERRWATFRVAALGEVRSEVEWAGPGRGARVRTITENGALLTAERYESVERLALRRALEACSSGARVADLDELLHDAALLLETGLA